MKTLEKVPWFNKEEWDYCSHHLFGNDLYLKKKALEHLYVWKVRCPNLPIAVECTLILMEAHLKEGEKLDNEKTLSNTMNYESWYSVAVMRFLNLILDSNVGVKSTSSMNKLAKQNNIPEWIVEIRNSVAHGPTLPSISLLEEAIKYCLQWIYDSYWSKDMYEDVVADENSLYLSATFQCFEACLLTRKYILFGLQNFSQSDIKERHKILNVLRKTERDELSVNFETWSLEEVHNCLHKKLRKHLKKDTKYGIDLIKCIVNSDDYLIMKTALKDDVGFDEKFTAEWEDVLSVIKSSSLCSHLLEELANVVVAPLEENWRQYCAALHLKEIFTDILQNKRLSRIVNKNVENNSKKGKKSNRNKHSKDDISNFSCDNRGKTNSDYKLTEKDVSKILSIVLNHPNDFVKVFLKSIIDVSDSFSKSLVYEDLLTLINIYLGKRSEQSKLKIIDDGKMRTLNDLQDNTSDLEIVECVKTIEVRETEPMNVANYVPNETGDWDWKNTPLGILPWQTEFNPWINIYISE